MHIPQTDSSLEQSLRGLIRRAIVPFVLMMFFLVCAGSPPDLRADPISFTITWTLSTGSLAPDATTYTYDSATNLFADFSISWNGVTFQMADVLNSFTPGQRDVWQLQMLDPSNNTWVGHILANAPSSSIFVLRTVASVSFEAVAISPTPPGGQRAEALGSYTVAQTSVPEPATLTLCGIGVGGLLLTRYARSKRRKRAQM